MQVFGPGGDAVDIADVAGNEWQHLGTFSQPVVVESNTAWIYPDGDAGPPVAVGKVHDIHVLTPKADAVIAASVAKMTEAFKKIDVSGLKAAFAKFDAELATPLVDKWLEQEEAMATTYGIKYPAGHVPEFEPEEHAVAVNANGKAWLAAQHGSHLGDDIGVMRMSCPDCRALWDRRWDLVTAAFITRLTDLGIGQQLRDKIIKALDEADTATADGVVG
jgi:hypothetical protein